MGLVYFIAFFFVIHCVKHIGASITTVVSVLSLLFPVTLAALLWSEIPDPSQSFGIALALLALLLVSVRWKAPAIDAVPTTANRHFLFNSAILLVFFILCGFSRLAQETFKHVSEPGHRPVFLFSAFGVTASFSAITLIYRQRRIPLTELGMGLLMGTANVFQTLMILKCLELYPGYIVFPATSAGTIVLTTIVATSLMGERIENLAILGIGMAVLSLFILT
jgi:drug/metabolite transporter (DMT)-like permease